MQEQMIDQMEMKTGTIATRSSVDGLAYFTQPGSSRVAIGANGVCILTRAQALQLVEELPGILEVFCACSQPRKRK